MGYRTPFRDFTPDIRAHLEAGGKGTASQICAAIGGPTTDNIQWRLTRLRDDGFAAVVGRAAVADRHGHVKKRADLWGKAPLLSDGSTTIVGRAIASRPELLTVWMQPVGQRETEPA